MRAEVVSRAGVGVFLAGLLLGSWPLEGRAMFVHGFTAPSLVAWGVFVAGFLVCAVACLLPSAQRHASSVTRGD